MEDIITGLRPIEAGIDEEKKEIKIRIQRPWKLGKCFHCGNAIHVIDDLTPYDCPLCHHSRG